MAQEVGEGLKLSEGIDKFGPEGYRVLALVSEEGSLRGTILDEGDFFYQKPCFGTRLEAEPEPKGKVRREFPLPTLSQAAEVLITGLAARYPCAQAVELAGQKMIKGKIGGGEEREERYANSLSQWLGLLNPQINKVIYNSYAREAAAAISLGDQDLLLTPEGRERVVTSQPNVYYFPPDDERKLEVSIFEAREKQEGSSLGEEELALVREKVSKLGTIFRLSGESFSFLILPQNWLRTSFCGRIIVLAKTRGVSGEPKATLPEPILVHEIVHSILFKKHGLSPVPGVLEGVAEGVAKIETSSRLLRGMEENLEQIKAEGLRIARSEGATRISETRLLQEEGGDNAYLKAYHLGALIVVVRALFPKSWAAITEEFYAATCRNLYDPGVSDQTGRRGKLLVKDGQMVVGVERRAVIHAALGRAIFEKTDKEERRNILREEKDLVRYVESLTLALVRMRNTF